MIDPDKFVQTHFWRNHNICLQVLFLVSHLEVNLNLKDILFLYILHYRSVELYESSTEDCRIYQLKFEKLSVIKWND